MEKLTGESSNQDISHNLSAEDRIAGASDKINRREFLEKVALVALSALLTGCIQESEESNEVLTSPRDENTPNPEEIQTATDTNTPSPTATPSNTRTPTPTSTQTPTPTPTETATRTRIPTSEDPLERGYTISYTYDDETGDKINYVTVFNSSIEDYQIVNDEEIQFKVKMKLYGQEIEGMISGSDVRFSRHNLNSRETTLIEYLTPDSNLEPYRLLEPGRDYNLALYIDGYNTFNGELFEDYINGEVDLKFLVRTLIVLVE